jgi:hypothetical protein
MFLRVRQVERPGAGRDGADEALAETQLRMVHGVGIEAFGGVEFEHAVGAQHVERAHLRDHVAAMSRTIRSSRSCGSSCICISSRRRFSSTRGPTFFSGIWRPSKVFRPESGPNRPRFRLETVTSLLLIETVDRMQSPHRQFGVGPSIRIEILISDVVMARMLMPFSASALNAVAATPAWLRMPMPITDTFDMPSSCWTTSKPTFPSPCRGRQRLVTSPDGTVKVMSVRAVFRNVLHDHVDIDAASASGPKMPPATPGRSATRRSEIWASSLA